jgi:general secretion pathway protein E
MSSSERSPLQRLLEGKRGEDFLTTLHSAATESGISDLHFFPRKGEVELAWREDGEMKTVLRLSHDGYIDVLRRIKFVAKLSLNVTQVPQDGEYAFPQGEREVKVRVSTLPSKFGEALTLRLLDPKRGIVPLGKLGFQPDIERELRLLIEKPHGIMLVTGPTGSGKTTTLYSLLALLIGTGRNIITLEDPIEYELPEIIQSQIDHRHEYTFARGLRAILRQDPDVILVGEIRDPETAKTAADAALTGHMVFATLHTNSAIESIPRLVSMGVDTYLLAPAVRAILAQRLIRRVCSDCKGKEGVTCATCGGSGYKGRLSLPELLTVDTGLRDLILENAEQKVLEEYVKKHGFRSMKERGEDLVKAGLTSKAEVARVTA